MKKLLLILLLIVFFITNAIAQPALNHIIELWKEGRYKEAYEDGKRIRETILEGEAIPALDFIMFSSMCRIPDKKEKGCIFFNKVLKEGYYEAVSDEFYNEINNEYNYLCNQRQASNRKIDIDSLVPILLAHQNHSIVESKFKSYLIESISDTNYKKHVLKNLKYDSSQFSITRLKRPTEFNVKNIQAFNERKLNRGDNNKAKKLASSAFKNYDFLISSNFCIIKSESNKTSLNNVASNLEQVYSYYKSFYELPHSKTLVVIYLSDTYPELKNTVKRIYDIDLWHDEFIGFSNIHDNSITAWIKNSGEIGTLKHELIHLLFNKHLNNYPSWLEEGIASLYEESAFNNEGELVGRKSWRLKMLKNPIFSYSITDLMNKNDSMTIDYQNYQLDNYTNKLIKEVPQDVGPEDIEDARSFIRESLENYFKIYQDALSRYFAMYLQEKDRLKPVHDALRERDLKMFDDLKFESSSNLIPRVCRKKNVEKLNKDFATWLAAKFDEK